jgi:hypothetical protein
MEKLPFALVVFWEGQVALLTLPPLHYEFEYLFIINHLHHEPPTNPLLVSAVFLERERHLVLADEKHFIRSYDLSEVYDELQTAVLANRKPRFSEDWEIRFNYTVKAHPEQIIFLKAFSNESILCTSAFDKKVRFWESSTGHFIDSLEQSRTKASFQPIAFTKPGSNTVFDMNGQILKQNSKIDPTCEEAEIDPYYYVKRLGENAASLHSQ